MKIFLLLLIYAVIAVLTIYFFDGTGDSGDSVHHYLFAKYAPYHPKLYFDHWAKPFFVLLASPFAQLGFVGVKIFNVIASIVSTFFTYKSIEKLEIKNPLVGAIILLCCPLAFVLTFSGLTEPLFAMFISWALYNAVTKQYTVAALIISFLPFVRSEGLIFMGVFGFYFLLKRYWKGLPLLFVGHLVYSIAGFLVYQDLLWVFKKIPYAKLSSIYGEGKLFHFVDQLFYVIGLPIYVLLGLGVIAIIWKSIQRKTNLEVQVLVFLGFLAFLVAHSLFWYLGIFNSMGLKRVLVGVAPLIAVMGVIGFNFITEDLLAKKEKIKKVVQGILIAAVLIFPFSGNPAGIKIDRDLKLTQEQVVANKLADYIKANLDFDRLYIHAHPYLSELLNIDHFDEKRRAVLNPDFIYQMQSGDIVIWDDWFAVVDKGVTKASMESNTALTKLYELKEKHKNREIEFVVYQKK